MRRGVYIMKGTITMKIDGPKMEVAVRLSDVTNLDKCIIVDNLLNALCEKEEDKQKVLSIALFGNSKEGNKDESRCF